MISEILLELSTKELLSSLVLLLGLFLIVFKRFDAFLLLFLTILPFNISFRVPRVLIERFSIDVYALGVESNYLYPTLHLTDFFLILTLLMLRREVFTLLIKSAKPFLFFILGWGLLQLIFVHELNNTFWVLRIIGWAFLLYSVDFAKVHEFLTKNRQKIAVILMISLLAQLIISFVQFRVGGAIGLTFIGESEIMKGALGTSFLEGFEGIYLRGYGTFAHPNILSAFAVLMALYATYLYRSDLMKRLEFYTVLLFSTIIIFLSFSKVGIFQIAIILFANVSHEIWNRTREKNSNSIASSFILFDLFQTRLTKERVLASFGERYELLAYSAQILQENLFFGVGFSRYVTALTYDAPVSERGLTLIQPVHNIFMLSLAENGVIFGGIFILALGYFFMKNIHLSQQKSLSLLVITVFLIAAMSDHYFITQVQGLIMLLGYLFLLALAATPNSVKSKI